MLTIQMVIRALEYGSGAGRGDVGFSQGIVVMDDGEVAFRPEAEIAMYCRTSNDALSATGDADQKTFVAMGQIMTWVAKNRTGVEFEFVRTPVYAPGCGETLRQYRNWLREEEYNDRWSGRDEEDEY